MHSELNKFVQAISESTVLTALIEDLDNSPQALRDATINRLISEMTDAKVSQEYIDHISLLRDTATFKAIVETIKEHGNTA